MKVAESTLPSGDPEKLLEAAAFFERLTGIGMRGEMFTFGFLPAPEAAEDLEKIKEWYALHGNQLIWDVSSQQVVLQEPHQR